MGPAKCCMLLMGIILGLAGIGLIGFNFVGKGIIKGLAQKTFVALAPTDGAHQQGDGYAALDVYLYNVTNVDALLIGGDSGKPKVQEVGPFRFRMYSQSLNIKHDGANYDVTSLSYYGYDKAKSCPAGESNCNKELTDLVDVIDTTYHGLVSGMLHGTLGEAGGAALFGGITASTLCNQAYPLSGISAKGISTANFNTAQTAAFNVYFNGDYTDCETKMAMDDPRTTAGAAYRAAAPGALSIGAIGTIIGNSSRYAAAASGGFAETCTKARAGCFATMFKNAVLYTYCIYYKIKIPPTHPPMYVICASLSFPSLHAIIISDVYFSHGDLGHCRPNQYRPVGGFSRQWYGRCRRWNRP